MQKHPRYIRSFPGFGIGSVIYSGLQFGQFFELSSQPDCHNTLKAVKPLLRIIFALMQMLFIFSDSYVYIQLSVINYHLQAARCFTSVQGSAEKPDYRPIRADAYDRDEPVRVAVRADRGDPA